MSESNLPAVLKTAISEQRIDLAKVNLMLPTQTFGEVLGQYDRVTIEVVTIDPDPRNGEVSLISGKKALGRVPLEKIGAAVGIIWDPANTTILESSATKSRAKATGALRKPNGEWIVLSEEKTVDLAAFEEEQRLGIEEKAAKGNPEKVTKWEKTASGKSYPAELTPWASEEEKLGYIELAVRKALLQYRKFKDERAMTGAKERCIRALLAIKSSYTDAELSRPFAFPRVLPDVNKMLADPEVRQAAIERMTGTAAAIFGPGNGGRRERDVTPVATIEAPPATADPLPAGECGSDPFAEEPAQDSEPEATPEDEARLKLEEMLNSPIIQGGNSGSERCAVIRELIANENASLESLQDMVKRCTDFLKHVEAGGAK